MLSSRLPVTIRLNRSFFPADLITVRTRGKNTLDGFDIYQASADDVLKAHSGGGGGWTSLGPSESVDVFVRDDDHLRSVDYPPLQRALFMPVRRGSAGAIWIRWERVNGKDAPGEVCIIWTHEDRAAGLAPMIAVGSAAAVISAYINDTTQPVTGALLGIRRRVPGMRRRDVRERIRYERRGIRAAMGLEQPVRVKSISIEGFRGFREEATLKLAQPSGVDGSGLTFVVGANNTGKSTVWESFDAIARKLKSDVSFSEGRRNRGTPGGVRIQLTRADGSTYLVESRNANTSETKAQWSPAEVAYEPFEIVSVPSRRQFQASFGRNTLSQRDWMTSASDFTRFRQQNDQFTGRLFDLHNNDEKKSTFDNLMTEVLGHPLEWTIELGDGQFGQSSYYLKVTTGGGVNHSSEGLGDGIISLLYILNALYDSEPGTLLVLDEPELSLHPQLVRRLGRVLARFAATRQIVVFTHSPHLVSWDDIRSGAEIARVYKEGADSKIAQATRATIDDISRARGGWRNPHTLGVDANEALFLDDGVIVVEGQEDAVLLPRAFEFVGVKRVGTVFGWGSGGQGNVAKIVGLLKDLGFTRVAAVLDNNVPDTATAIRDMHPDVLVAEIPAADIHDKPQRNSPAVEGLLSEDGKAMKEHLRADATAVLSRVADYLSTGRLPAQDDAVVHAEAQL